MYKHVASSIKIVVTLQRIWRVSRWTRPNSDVEHSRATINMRITRVSRRNCFSKQVKLYKCARDVIRSWVTPAPVKLRIFLSSLLWEWRHKLRFLVQVHAPFQYSKVSWSQQCSARLESEANLHPKFRSFPPYLSSLHQHSASRESFEQV